MSLSAIQMSPSSSHRMKRQRSSHGNTLRSLRFIDGGTCYRTMHWKYSSSMERQCCCRLRVQRSVSPLCSILCTGIELSLQIKQKMEVVCNAVVLATLTVIPGQDRDAVRSALLQLDLPNLVDRGEAESEKLKNVTTRSVVCSYSRVHNDDDVSTTQADAGIDSRSICTVCWFYPHIYICVEKVFMQLKWCLCYILLLIISYMYVAGHSQLACYTYVH